MPEKCGAVLSAEYAAARFQDDSGFPQGQPPGDQGGLQGFCEGVRGVESAGQEDICCGRHEDSCQQRQEEILYAADSGEEARLSAGAGEQDRGISSKDGSDGRGRTAACANPGAGYPQKGHAGQAQADQGADREIRGLPKAYGGKRRGPDS